MDNFTPLKTKKKKKVNIFLIVGNMFLVTVLIFMTSIFLKDKLIATQQKAAVPLPTQTPTATRTPTPTPSRAPTPTLVLSVSPTVTMIPTGQSTVTVTPTEIVIAKISTSPTVVVSLPKTGTIKSFIYIVPALIMLVGLIL